MAQDPFQYFRIEAKELLEGLSQGVLALEKGQADEEVVTRLLRQAHTLKGASRVVKQLEIADLAHAVEDVLSPFRGSAEIPFEFTSKMFQLIDSISNEVTKLDPKPPTKTEIAFEENFDTVRVGTLELDAILESSAEASTQLLGVRKKTLTLKNVARVATTLLASFDEVPAPQTLRRQKVWADQLRAELVLAEHELADGLEQAYREIEEIQKETHHLRLVPVNTLFSALSLGARDAANLLNKRVHFEASGGDIRLDAHVLVVVRDALLHLVRNAVAHGIESPEKRLEQRKPPEGSVTLKVQRRGDRVTFSCVDDGAGIDLEAIRKAARQKGLRASDDKQLLELILKGGVSTAEKVSEISGRGIGLSAVKSAANKLKGDVHITSQQGIGTTVDLIVPVSMTWLNALLVEVRGITIAVPLDAVSKTLRLEQKDIASSSDGETIIQEDMPIPFVPLAQILHWEHAPRKLWNVAVVEGSGGRVALGIDRLIGTSSIVVKKLPEDLQGEEILAGAALDIEGNPQLVIDPQQLSVELHRFLRSSHAEVRSAAPVLVIDDSLTTRMLEQSILEAAGFPVEVAVSAEEAMEKALKQSYSVFVVDVEMPGMNGFEFIESVQRNEALRHIPCILVTSLNSNEDKARGERVGAKAYIVKGEFDQENLLNTIRKWVQNA
jgi:two-component system, chemotaxis family, sensor kinase CheA